MSDVPGSKTPAERQVPVPHLPANVLAELMSRPTKNTTTIERQTFPDTRPVTRIEVPPAPIVDVRTSGPQVPRGDNRGAVIVGP